MTTVAAEAAAIDTQPPDSEVRRTGSRRGLIGYAVTVVALVATIIGVRMAGHRSVDLPTPVSIAHPAAPFPASPQVEAAWGLRFTNVIVLADNGGVELRYQVIDAAKAQKIHLGNADSNELPSLRVEQTGAMITPSAVLLHFHHGDTVSGQSYSIVYGNAGGVVHSGGYVTLIMKDGLMIKHIQVSD